MAKNRGGCGRAITQPQRGREKRRKRVPVEGKPANKTEGDDSGGRRDTGAQELVANTFSGTFNLIDEEEKGRRNKRG